MSATFSLVDSHCHLDRLDLEQIGGMARVMERASEQGVDHQLCVSINLEALPGMLEIVRSYPNVYASVGVHPNEQVVSEPTVDQLVKLADDPQVIAIGETGLDYFRSEGDLAWQRDRLRVHIMAAKACEKPLIIHCRDAKEDVLAILEAEKADRVGGVMHCFVDDWESAERAMALGFYISFSGIVTFNSAQALKEVARRVPLERMLVETDSPYLAPVPHRGKSNQPAYTRYVAEYIAKLRGISLHEVAEATSNNFFQLFTPCTSDSR